MTEVAISPGRQPTAVLDRHLSDTAPRQFWRTLLYLGAFAAVALLAFSNKNVLGICLMLAGYMAFLMAARKVLWDRTPWPLPQPVLILSVWWFFSFGISSLPKFLGTSNIHWDLAGHEGYLYWALALVILSNALVVAGYLCVWPTKLARENSESRELRGSLSLVVVIGFWLVSIVARIYLIASGRFGYTADFSRAESGFRQTATFAYEFAWVAIAAMVVEWMTTKDPAKRLRIAVLFVLVSIVELVSVVVMGFKGYVGATFAAAAVALWGFRRVPPYKLVGAAIVIALLITPGNLAWRQDYNKGKIDRRDFVTSAESALAYTFREISRNPFGGVAAAWKSATLEFSDFLENTALVIYKTPSQVPYKGVEPYFTVIPRALFPRFVWKDKPIDDLASYMTVVYRNGPGTTGSSPGYTGEMYMRGGLGAVVVGSLITGAALGLVVRIFSRGRRKVLFVAASGIFAATLTNTEFGPLIVYLIQRGVIYSVAAWFMFFGIRRPAEVGGDEAEAPTVPRAAGDETHEFGSPRVAVTSG